MAKHAPRGFQLRRAEPRELAEDYRTGRFASMADTVRSRFRSAEPCRLKPSKGLRKRSCAIPRPMRSGVLVIPTLQPGSASSRSSYDERAAAACHQA